MIPTYALVKPSREAIAAALIAMLQTMTLPGGAPFQTIDRTWTGVDNSLTLDKLPGLFLLDLGESVKKDATNMPAKIDWKFDVVIVQAIPEGTLGITLANQMLDALELCFQPTPAQRMGGNFITLGGLVQHVWIEGAIQKNPSSLSGSASLAVAPLHVRITNPL